MKPLGKLTVVCGSMFAGKSEELIRLARRALYAKRKIQVFKPSIDDRYHQTMVVSHQGISFEAETVNGVNELRKKLQSDVQMVLIEEVQFFDISIVELCVELTDKGVEVVVAGLDQDFRRQPFGPMASLLIAADEVVKLRAICMKCGQIASHTYRMVDEKPARWDDPIVLIGATESYEARCRNCFEIRKSKKK